MPAESTERRLVSVSRGSKRQIDYRMSDQTEQSFRCEQAFADLVMEAWGCRAAAVHELDPDAARLIVDQICDILNLDGGPGVVYGEVVAFVGALRRERDNWRSAYDARRTPADAVVSAILKEVQELAGVVRGIRDAR